MAVTYTTIKGTDIRVPVLHRVVYARIDPPTPKSWEGRWFCHKDHSIEVWLEENCQHPYHRCTVYTDEKFVDFQDSEEAVLFALRWS